ncbi:hypothetical protein [Streptomyces sp. NPDC051162]|uniref:hypothetical protein n=1 Tax=unclassified Streptomyces TaxID=2593676 RepID=UPI003445657A
MTTIRVTRPRRGALPIAVLALLLAGCGTQRSGDDTGAHAAAPSAPVDGPCPGDSSALPSATAGTPDPATPPTDHYAENHGFMVPLPLHGRSRCDGLAAVGRVKGALEPLRKRGDFVPGHSRDAITGLGYPAGKVKTYENGPTGVGFLIDASPLCVEGTMSRDSTQAEAFGGYPDHFGCDQPRGGH